MGCWNTINFQNVCLLKQHLHDEDRVHYFSYLICSQNVVLLKPGNVPSALVWTIDRKSWPIFSNKRDLFQHRDSTRKAVGSPPWYQREKQ